MPNRATGLLHKFSAKVREKLGCYVYLYIDPRTGEPFYIGKGQGNRAFSHLKDRSEAEKARVIRQLAKLGLEPRIEILKYGLTEEQALLVESTAIDLLAIRKLTNRVRGHGSRHGARAPVNEIAALLDAKEVQIKEPAILINITRAYHYGISPQALYDATRSAWKIGNRKKKPELAISVYRGVVREVYQIAAWVKGGTTMRHDDQDGRHKDMLDRQEFVGEVADEAIRRKYVGRSVRGYFARGAQNPIKYVNC